MVLLRTGFLFKRIYTATQKNVLVTMVVNKPKYKWVVATLGILGKISNNCRGADKILD